MVAFLLLVGLLVLLVLFAIAYPLGPWAWTVVLGIVLALIGVLIYDLTQRRHSILRNYPLIGHIRYMLESIRPELQQYFIERNYDGKPFDRDTRSMVYARAKGQDDHKAFGTERNIRELGYEYFLQSVAPVAPPEHPPKITIGGPDCTQPYQISLMNISSMSFGALSDKAVLAMNKGAALGNFVHETGEGGITKYHLEYGADLFWEIGSGYFGCRNHDGSFNAERFAEKARWPQVKGVTIKVSQGAKPGLGGVLPAAKLTPAIAQARDVPMGQDCVSPASHPEFSTPRELMEFVARLRELSDGKPVGYKFCVGSRVDVLSMCKAMLDTGITPDFIIIDGAEGGTGAAPLEYEDTVGAPLTEGLMVMHNALVGCGLRGKIKIGVAGKIALGSDIVKRLIQGADFTMSARAMMMATGCIQSQRCHTNKCPVGVTSQNPRLTRALDVEDKGTRVYNYHKLTVKEAVQLMASMGVSDTAMLNPRMLRRRVDHYGTRSYASMFSWLRPGQLLEEPPQGWGLDWRDADPDRFGLARLDPFPHLRGELEAGGSHLHGQAAHPQYYPERDDHQGSSRTKPKASDVPRPEGQPG